MSSAARAPAKLRVGFAGSAPFVLGTSRPEGLSIDVWRLVAERVGLEYELSALPSIADAVSAVKSGALDIAIGPISITSKRAELVRFSQPYFNSQLGIAAAPGSASIWARVKPFIGRVFAGTSLLLLLLLFGVGSLIWLLERRSPKSQFPREALPGIGDGVWFALVTMTTVGYGDRVPVTGRGRVVAGLWMLIALVTTSSLTAGLASAFTVLQLDTASIHGAAELRGRKVAMVAGTTGADFALRQAAILSQHDTFEQAVEELELGRVAAVVHDRPMLQYYLAQTPDSALKLVGANYAPQSYGFAVASELDIVRKLNIALLASQESGELPRIVRAWLGVSSAISTR